MSTTVSGSKSKQVSVTTRHAPRQPQKQRNYAITCGGMVVVLKTQVAGSLYIITGVGKRKCIEINIDVSAGSGFMFEDLESNLLSLGRECGESSPSWR
jgi:hypothetical protein